MRYVADLNADVGEGFGVWSLGEDAALLDVITSANVACGFHAGDPTIMRRVCDQAVARGVRIGAQVGYRDLAGFGRRDMDVEPEELVADLIYQIGALDGFARVAGDRVRYVKPHGALYNAAANSAELARVVVRAVQLYDPALPLVGLAGSELTAAALSAGVTAVPEAFADRAYTAEGRLVSRRLPGAVLDDGAAIAQRCVELARDGVVRAIDGALIEVAALSICVHGDTQGAVAIARSVWQALIDAGVTVASFVDR